MEPMLNRKAGVIVAALRRLRGGEAPDLVARVFNVEERAIADWEQLYWGMTSIQILRALHLEADNIRLRAEMAALRASAMPAAGSLREPATTH